MPCAIPACSILCGMLQRTSVKIIITGPGLLGLLSCKLTMWPNLGPIFINVRICHCQFLVSLVLCWPFFASNLTLVISSVTIRSGFHGTGFGDCYTGFQNIKKDHGILNFATPPVLTFNHGECYCCFRHN